MDRAVAAAREAFDHGPWPRLTFAERAAVIGRLAEIYAARQAEMAALITEEMGSPITFSNLAQAPQPLEMLQYYADSARLRRRRSSGPACSGRRPCAASRSAWWRPSCRGTSRSSSR